MRDSRARAALALALAVLVVVLPAWLFVPTPAWHRAAPLQISGIGAGPSPAEATAAHSSPASLAAGCAALFAAAAAAAGSRRAARRQSRVVRCAGDEDMLRLRDRRDGHGWKKEDPEFDVTDAGSLGNVVSVEMKKRPMGVTRFTHGEDGKGAMVMEMHEKARYPGDPRGQSAVGGVTKGYVVKSIGGQECANWDFVDIMDLLQDWEPDYNLTQEARNAWDARPRKYQPIELPTTVEFQECAAKKSTGAAPKKEAGKWYPRGSGYTDEQLAEERKRAAGFPAPASYTGVVYTGPECLTEEWIKALIAQQKEGILLPKESAYNLVIDAIKALKKEKTMSEFELAEGQTVTVLGDLHGQYWDLMNIFEINGLPSPSNPFLFNGDFVDRGSWSIENILLVYAMKVKDPDYVHLNRGNHELIEANLIYGFCGECFKKYDSGLFDLFSESFRHLSLCHLINKSVFACHGGLPGPQPRLWCPGQSHDPEDAIPVNVSSLTLKEIAAVDRQTELQAQTYKDAVFEPDEKPRDQAHAESLIVIDLMWADPRGGAGYGPSYRKSKGIFMFGPDVTAKFCADNGLKYVVRSHEVKSLGWYQDHPQLYTVFSAPDYMDTGGNKGGYIKLKNVGGEITCTPHSFDKSPHPDLKPMVYQEYMAEVNPHLTKKMKKKAAVRYDADGNRIEIDDTDMGDSDFGQSLADEWVEDDGEEEEQAVGSKVSA